LWTDSVDFVSICYIQCDLFDCYIFNYEIMPAVLASTFSFILQGSALADLGMVVDFRMHLVVVNFCLQQWKIYWNQTAFAKVMLQWKSVQFFLLSVYSDFVTILYRERGHTKDVTLYCSLSHRINILNLQNWHQCWIYSRYVCNCCWCVKICPEDRTQVIQE